MLGTGAVRVMCCAPSLVCAVVPVAGTGSQCRHAQGAAGRWPALAERLDSRRYLPWKRPTTHILLDPFSIRHRSLDLCCDSCASPPPLSSPPAARSLLAALSPTVQRGSRDSQAPALQHCAANTDVV